MIETRQVQYAKELDEAMSAVIGIIKDVRSGKNVLEIITGNIPALIAAVGGLEQVQGELSQNFQVASETIGYRLGDLTSALLNK